VPGFGQSPPTAVAPDKLLDHVLAELSPSDAPYARYVRVVDVPAVADGRHLEIVMDGEHERAVGYLK